MNTTLTDGSPVTPDHREIDPATGQQKAYVVLSAEERAKTLCGLCAIRTCTTSAAA